VPRRRLTWVLAALASLACVPTAAAAPATVQVSYSPFAPDGTLVAGLRASPAFGGTCDSGSFVVATESAFRCFVGDTIRDPCFADVVASTAERAVVVCVGAPWATDVVRLRLTSPPVGVGRVAPGGPPWALRLSSGRRCLFNQGASPTIAGRRQNYTCTARHWLFGTPDRTTATWRIRQADAPGGAHLRKVAIATAWS